MDLDYLNKLKDKNLNLESSNSEKNTKNKKQVEINSFINNLIKKIFSQKEIDIDEISKVMDYIYKEKNFSKQLYFLEKINVLCSSKYK